MRSTPRTSFKIKYITSKSMTIWNVKNSNFNNLLSHLGLHHNQIQIHMVHMRELFWMRKLKDCIGSYDYYHKDTSIRTKSTMLLNVPTTETSTPSISYVQKETDMFLPWTCSYHVLCVCICVVQLFVYNHMFLPCIFIDDMFYKWCDDDDNF